ncbi:hypothetical protein AJ88_13165 [Mesorhizobium amorphae CCBAU 01583]|nr:hypothetical protein AJ88_13165 [Mesorhizobium amorphae CCBAU 01583]
MIVLFTDFGLHGPYTGQMKAVSSIQASEGRGRPSSSRPTVAGMWPGNGLFELIQRRAAETFSWDIDWKPERLSASFHGRDPGRGHAGTR